VLLVALFGGLSGIHALDDRVFMCLPGHPHYTCGEFIPQRGQYGLVELELLRGGWEQSEQGGSLGLIWGIEEIMEVRGLECVMRFLTSGFK
jgi:hypothetical protein